MIKFMNKNPSPKNISPFAFGIKIFLGFWAAAIGVLALIGAVFALVLFANGMLAANTQPKPYLGGVKLPGNAATPIVTLGQPGSDLTVAATVAPVNAQATADAARATEYATTYKAPGALDLAVKPQPKKAHGISYQVHKYAVFSDDKGNKVYALLVTAKNEGENPGFAMNPKCTAKIEGRVRSDSKLSFVLPGNGATYKKLAGQLAAGEEVTGWGVAFIVPAAYSDKPIDYVGCEIANDVTIDVQLAK